jgi:hypothetical protein
MSRNDQVTRQWLLLKILGKPGGATIDEIIGFRLENYACPTRTIRRNFNALEVCFPIYTDHIDGFTRWKLVEGFNHVPAHLPLTVVLSS